MSLSRSPCGYEMKRAHTQSTALPGSTGALPSTRIWHRWAPKAEAARELRARRLHQSLPSSHRRFGCLSFDTKPSPSITALHRVTAGTTNTMLSSLSQARECQGGRHSWPVPHSCLAQPSLWPSSPRTPSKGRLGYDFKLGWVK